MVALLMALWRSVRSFEWIKASSIGLLASRWHDAGAGSCCSVGEVLSLKKDGLFAGRLGEIQNHFITI